MAKKSVNLDIPSQGFVFWPVGTGDSTTIAVTDEVFLQVDLRHMKSADEEDDPHTPIVDRLVELLPQVNGKPYLPVFALTHPDEDHCLGFDDLLKRVNIGELWFTPRIFREYKKDLCDDAQAFRKEAKRRVKKTIQEKEDVASGDRVRIIGYDDLLKDEEYEGFPRERLTIPGNEILELDGEDQSDYFRAFVHAPFKDDAASERNDTSLALQVTLYQDDKSARALLLGDLCYPIIRQIFDRSKDDDLKWNVMLAPHHCSKSVMQIGRMKAKIRNPSSKTSWMIWKKRQTIPASSSLAANQFRSPTSLEIIRLTQRQKVGMKKSPLMDFFVHRNIRTRKTQNRLFFVSTIMTLNTSSRRETNLKIKMISLKRRKQRGEATSHQPNALALGNIYDPRTKIRG